MPSHSSAGPVPIHGAYISGMTLSLLMQQLHSRAHEGTSWYDLEGLYEHRTEATDAHEDSARVYLVITGFARSRRQGSPSDESPLRDHRICNVGRVVMRRAAMHHFPLTYRESQYLLSAATEEPADGARRARYAQVLFLLTDTPVEIGSLKLDFTLLQTPAAGAKAPEQVRLSILNMRDSSSAFDAIVEAAAFHPLSPFPQQTADSTDDQRRSAAQSSVSTIEIDFVARMNSLTTAVARSQALLDEMRQLQAQLCASSPHPV